MTLGRPVNGIHLVDTVDAASVNVRYWRPPVPNGQLVIFNHQYGANEAITPPYWAFPLVHAAIQSNASVIASRLHGDNWGNAASLADVVAAYNLMNALNPVSSVVLVGASMGGLASLLTAAKGNLPAGKLKGVYLIDAVTDLSWAYTATAAGTPNAYQSSINTAYGVSALASIPAGQDPRNGYAASVYAGLRLRFYASTIDANVAKTQNTDAFAAFVTAAATESAIVTHNASGHTADCSGKDFAAFLSRCA